MKTPLAALAVLAIAAPAAAHITPPVTLATEREAVTRLLSGSARYFVREVRLAGAQKEEIRKRTGWKADDDYYRFYVGRGADGAAVASAVLITDFTIHGPVRVAVALGPDGKVRSAVVVEVTEETYAWVKPLLDSGLMQRFAGSGPGGISPGGSAAYNSMQRFYAGVIAGLVDRAAVLYQVAIEGR